MDLFASQLLNGLGNGVVYASLGLALVLIFRTTGFLNFAQGEMALFSTYVTWKLTEWDVPIVAAIAISMAFSFVMGVVIERVVIRPIEGGSPRKRASRSASNICRNPARKSARTSSAMLAEPLTSGTCATTAFTRRSIAPTTSTCPPE